MTSVIPRSLTNYMLLTGVKCLLQVGLNNCMKINEVTPQPKTYTAIVRLKLQVGSITLPMTILAESHKHATEIVHRVYGDENVMDISLSSSEPSRRHQINAQATFPKKRMPRQPHKKKIAPVVFSCVA